MVNLWNSLSIEVVEAASLNIFKSRVDRFLVDKGIKGESRKVELIHFRSAMILLNGGAGSRG